MRNTDAKIYMEQCFVDGERDVFEFKAPAEIEQSPGKLRVIFMEKEIFFDVEQVQKYESEGLQFNIATDKLLQLERKVEIEYRLFSSDGILISHNILKMELSEL